MEIAVRKETTVEPCCDAVILPGAHFPAPHACWMAQHPNPDPCCSARFGPAAASLRCNWTLDTARSASPFAAVTASMSSFVGQPSAEQGLSWHDLGHLSGVFPFKHVKASGDQDPPTWLLTQLQRFLTALEEQEVGTGLLSALRMHMNRPCRPPITSQHQVVPAKAAATFGSDRLHCMIRSHARVLPRCQCEKTLAG